MIEAPNRRTTETDAAAPTTRPPSSSWAGYAACAWTLGYTALKLYWALGGTALRSTIGFPDTAWHDRWFIAFGLWGTVAVGALGALVALALARSWDLLVPRRVLLTAAWCACSALVLRAVGGFLESGLRLTGVWGSAENPITPHLWNLALYSPYFLVWGVLYGATARREWIRSWAARPGCERYPPGG